MTKEQKKFLIDFLIDESNKLTDDYLLEKKRIKHYCDNDDDIYKDYEIIAEKKYQKIRKINEIIENLTHYD